MVIELESVKTRISAPAHPSATGIGRVSGLVFLLTCVLALLQEVRPSVVPSVVRSVGLSITKRFKMHKKANSDVCLHAYHLKCHTTFI